VLFRVCLALNNAKHVFQLQNIASLVVQVIISILRIIPVFKIALRKLILQALHAQLVNILVKVVYLK
jgi:hypothetical protein